MARKYEERQAKPANDAYTGMLVISFIALLMGCALLYLDYSQYDSKPPPKIERSVEKRYAPDEGPAKAKETPEGKETSPDEGKDTAKDKENPADKKDVLPEK